MAITTNIPPQAYTRDTLVKAIEWISHQPPAVRERASSADLIVSFYLQARRRMTAAQLEAPVSGENFKQDLKHLAQDLKKFEEPPAAPPTPPNRPLNHGPFELPDPVVQPQPSGPQSPQPVQLSLAYPPPVQVAPTPASSHAPAPSHTPSPQTPAAPAATSPTAAPPKNASPTFQIDARSMAAARELQQRFNLSNEGDAIRMLITLGLERLREMFPS